MLVSILVRAVLVTCLVAGSARVAAGQTIGTFRWQALPFCNVIELTIGHVGTVFTLDGFDDQCGAATQASVVGTAFFNPDGSVGIGLTTIGTPGGGPVHTDVALSLATLGGPWRDSAGRSGTLSFNPVNASGSPRPLPIVGAIVPATQFRFPEDGGFMARGQFGSGSIAASGAGTRMLWYPAKAAFRAGDVSASQWDDSNVGAYSVALGQDAIAKGAGSIALGRYPQALGLDSIAIGFDTRALARGDVAIGDFTEASGGWSTAFGYDTHAEGRYSTAMGFRSIASGDASLAIGYHASATGDYSVALGHEAETNGFGGAFVFADASHSNPAVASAHHQFTVRSAGGARFFSNPSMSLGVKLEPSAGAWTNASDAALKRDFRDLDGEETLRKLRAIPVREWSYISQDPAIRHVGPTAQDFRAAFGLGEDPLGITTIDADGIALRAIQALEARTSILSRDNVRLAAENDGLRRALDEIRQELAGLRARERR